MTRKKTESATRILVCDDHPLFRQGLRRLLETVAGFEVVGEVDRGDEVVEAVAGLRPDVVVLDVELPGASGIAVVERLRAGEPEARVIMLSGFGDADRVRSALRCGAHGYVLKNAKPNEIIDAIEGVAAGDSVLSPAVAQALASSVRDESAEDRARDVLLALSKREIEVLRLAARGNGNAAIGKILFISEGTVKNHMTQILRKLGVSDRTQAAIYAMKHGLADDPEDAVR